METRQRTTPEKLNVLAARLKLWLLDLLLWLSEWMGRALPRALRMEMRADIRQALQGTRVIVFLLAMSRCGAAPMHGQRQPYPPPRGFRRTGFLKSDLRSICRTVRLRGRTIAARLAELRAILDTLDVWIARVRRRLMALPHEARLVLCFALADRLCALTAPAPAFADSS
jgi:hypothetical protein